MFTNLKKCGRFKIGSRLNNDYLTQKYLRQSICFEKKINHLCT